MFALTLTLLTAIYLLGPDFVARFILDYAAPRRTIQQTKTEEISRAILIAAIPLILAVLWVTARGVVNWGAIKPDIQAFFAGIYSEKIFEDNPARFYRAAETVWSANLEIAWRLYALLVVWALIANVVISNFGNIRNSKLLANHSLAKSMLAVLILPRISSWHVLLTHFSHKKSADVRADILTKGDVLYRGTIKDLLLGPDGSLSGLLLSNAHRYKREEYLTEKSQEHAPSLDTEAYWKKIPGYGFLIMASEIVTINLRQYDPKEDPELMRQIREILKETVTASWRTPPPTKKKSGKRATQSPRT